VAEGEDANLVADLDYEIARLGSGCEASNGVQSVVDRILVDAGAATVRFKGPIRPTVAYPAVERHSAIYRDLCALVARGMRAELLAARNRYRPADGFTADPVFELRPGGFVGARRGVSGRSIRDLFLAFQAEKKSLSAVRDVDKRYGFVLRMVGEVLDVGRAASSLERTDLIAIMAFMQRLPSNAEKKFSGRSLSEVASLAEAQGAKLLAPNSVRKYMQALLAVIRWGEQNKWGLDVNVTKLIGKREARVQRRSFRSDELRVLFEALVPLASARPDRFWIPALGLLSGARLNEICQLHVEDVVQVGDVWCLNLSLFDENGARADDKRLKNEASERYVPIHPQAIASGFLRYVADQPRAGRLFTCLTPGPDGRYSHNVSKWFGRWLDGLGLTQPSLVFHSFRHGFRNACRLVPGITDEAMDALGGWAADNEGTKYGDRRMIPVLERAVRHMKFDGFELPVVA